jgi:ribonuclease P protein component
VILTAKRKTQLTKKKKVERFHVVSRAHSASPLFSASVIKWISGSSGQSKSDHDALLVTVPRVSGTAVLRNRWKRLIREWFYSAGLQITPGQSIWIRYNRTKNLKKPLLYQDWAPMLNSEVQKLKIPAPKNLVARESTLKE